VLLEQYGFIGDLESAAFAARDGWMDWLCVPRFDSAACIAPLLGDESDGLLLGPRTARGRPRAATGPGRSCSRQSSRATKAWCA
jgi:hypothetical protein